MKATTKPRRKIFFNKVDKLLYTEIKIGSDYFVNEKGEKIDLKTIESNLNIYIDLSLFPAHINRSYGPIADELFSNKMYWLFRKERYPILILINTIFYGFKNATITYRKIDNYGNIGNKQYLLTIPHEGYLRECKENYKIETKIKLI